MLGKNTLEHTLKFSWLYIILFFGISLPLFAQVTLSRQVIGVLGGTVVLGADKVISFTAGEAFAGTGYDEDMILTAGFHQPMPFDIIRFELEYSHATCPNSADGSARIFNIAGCREPYSILWSTGQTGEIAEQLSPGLYAVEVSSTECTESIAFEIGNGPAEHCKLLFYNAFSPNGDKVNDTWIIENIHLPDFFDNKIEIFNRWGQSIWTGSNYDNATVVWDGKTKAGQEVPTATYFYVAEVNDVVYKGFIELTR